MKKIHYAIAFLLLPLLSGCANFGEAGDTQFSGIATGAFLLQIFLLASPKVMQIINTIVGKEEWEELDGELFRLQEGLASREDLSSYRTANGALFSAVLIPTISWLLILFGMGGGNANIIGFILGIIAAVYASKKVFLFSDSLKSYTTIARILILAFAIFCFFLNS